MQTGSVFRTPAWAGPKMQTGHLSNMVVSIA